MVLMFVLLFFLHTSGIGGTELDYIFSDQADGWLKLYTVPLGWNDAKIRCDSEGAVLASPLAVQLRDEIKKHVSIVDRTIYTIYTGVQAEYKSGDFLSVEGVHVSSLSVPLLMGTKINYKSSESCIAWDMSYNNLEKVKCESKYPYVCYKKRTSAQVPIDTGLGTRDPESNPGIHPIPPGVQSQPHQRTQLIPQPQQPSGVQQNQRTQPTNRAQPTQQPPHHRTQLNQQTLTNQRTQPNHVPYEKCAIDGVNLFIINSELQFDALKVVANNPTVSIIFADTAYIKSFDESTWHVVVRKKPSQQQRGSPLRSNETTVVASIDVNKDLSPQFNKGIQTNVPQNQGSSTGTRGYQQGAILNYRIDKQTGWRMKMHRPDTWNAAKTQCVNEGAVLASPFTTQLNDAIKRYLSKVDRSVTTIFTGVHANFTNGDFYSTEGVPLYKMPVYLDSSANVVYENSESCITMTTLNTVVKSVKCTEIHPYVCLKRTLVRGCGTNDPGYTLDYSSSSCYKFHQQGKTWIDAYNTCIKEGGYLAIINSQKESVAMKKLFAMNPPSIISGYYPDSAYIGFRDWLDGKSWMTVKGKSLQNSGFIEWNKTEPNNAHGDENCGTFNRNGYFYDDPCELKLAFICEKDSIIVNP